MEGLSSVGSLMVIGGSLMKAGTVEPYEEASLPYW